MATMTTVKGDVHTIVLEQTKVARYVALDETAGGFAITNFDRHFQDIEFPGVAPVSAVILYRTRHEGSPKFSVRINSAPLTQYNFTENDPLERCWHEIIPAIDGGRQPTLKAQKNELVFRVSEGTVTFGDVVVLYTSNETTVKIPLTLNPTLHP
ncbi:hypothetical protein IVB30_18410 [Bradyrhizobium sp. 200]|uniref:hypothetical protein n=1 Tax=Bradyrhizobium sp. 200 TaxID=2782665 RepID=UPI001FFEE47F|nr:hypothetical protein [Bradyrhizobium sp. 200]UPJ53112.1 hypothetical protein IVB30_18410 [Bradyrhizobium sp. 200]